jgi:hypothetical protein
MTTIPSSLLWDKYFEAIEEIKYLKLVLVENAELIAKLRREVNRAEHKLFKQQFLQKLEAEQLPKKAQLSIFKNIPIQCTDIPYEIFRIDGLFTDKEIADMKTYVENASSDERPFTYSPFKNGKVINSEMSTKIYNKLVAHEGVPEYYKDRKGTKWELKGSSKYVYYAKLVPGQKFPIHTDTGSEFGAGGESKFTVLTYLNDDYSGGCTQFYNDSFEKTVSIKPKKGRTLIFDIDTFHAGDEVTCGEKYWFGTEIVYRKI